MLQKTTYDFLTEVSTLKHTFSYVWYKKMVICTIDRLLRYFVNGESYRPVSNVVMHSNKMTVP